MTEQFEVETEVVLRSRRTFRDRLTAERALLNQF